MSVQKIKGYSLSCLSFVLLSLLLLSLSGCDATSDPRQYFQLTGSWQGTIGTDRVRGIIAPDGSYQLAIVDANGDFIPENESGAGEYTGKATIVDKENNIGSLTVAILRPGSIGVEVGGNVTFKLGSSTLFSEDGRYPVNLSRTGDVVPGSYDLSAVTGRWSLAAEAKINNVMVAADGKFSGNDGDACQYDGTFKLLNSGWNIFQLDLSFKDLPGKDCPRYINSSAPYTYRGLVVPLPPANERRRLWLAANSLEISKNLTYLGVWIETSNVPPVARMTANTIALEESVVLPLKVKKLSGTIKLGAHESSDENKDALTYQWSGTDPDGASIFQSTPAEGVEVAFTPTKPGVYTLNLTANDGLLDSVKIERKIAVEWVADRFVNCQNGTVLDTTTNLFWLRDAGCPDLHDPIDGWVNLSDAKGYVGTLAASGCGLSDGSVAGDWRLPLLIEFASIIDTEETHSAWSAPALVNGVGDVQWTEGDIFIRVGKNPYYTAPVWTYWTSERITYEGGSYVNFDYRRFPPLSGYMATSNLNAVWPVRDERSPVAGDEVNACLQAAPQP